MNWQKFFWKINVIKMSYIPYKNYDAPQWVKDLQNNKWTIISFVVPAILSPIVGILIGEGMRYIRNKKKKKR